MPIASPSPSWLSSARRSSTPTNSVDSPLDRRLRYYRDKGCKGVGESMLNLPVCHPMVQILFKHAEAMGLPVTFDSGDIIEGDFGLPDDPGATARSDNQVRDTSTT